MKLDDERWDGLIGGYRLPYDPRPALKTIKKGEAEAGWSELWEKLHHQGDVNTASYAAVPEIVRLIADATSPDWNGYALIAIIEDCRLAGNNPLIPSWLEQDYQLAWADVLQPALRDFAQADDDMTVTSILAVLAYAKQQRTIATFALCTEDEREEMLDETSRS